MVPDLGKREQALPRASKLSNSRQRDGLGRLRTVRALQGFVQGIEEVIHAHASSESIPLASIIQRCAPRRGVDINAPAATPATRTVPAFALQPNAQKLFHVIVAQPIAGASGSGGREGAARASRRRGSCR